MSNELDSYLTNRSIATGSLIAKAGKAISSRRQGSNPPMHPNDASMSPRLCSKTHTHAFTCLLASGLIFPKIRSAGSCVPGPPVLQTTHARIGRFWCMYPQPLRHDSQKWPLSLSLPRCLSPFAVLHSVEFSSRPLRERSVDATALRQPTTYRYRYCLPRSLAEDSDASIM